MPLETDNTQNPVMDTDLYSRMAPIDSIDREAYFQGYGRPSVSAPKVEPLKARVMNGGFLSTYAKTTWDDLVVGTVKSLAGSLQFAGDLAPHIEANPLGPLMFGPEYKDIVDEHQKIMGEKSFGSVLNKFGLYMADEANKLLLSQQIEGEDRGFGSHAGEFLGHFSSSTLKTIGLMATGMGVGGVGAVFGAESAAGGYTDARSAGASFEKAASFNIVRGVLVTKLEGLGLKSIFKNTYRAGVNSVTRIVTNAMATEGATEALQQMVEIGTDMATGARQNVTLGSAIGETVYAAALGVFGGGVLSAKVAIPQRANAIKLLQQAGFDSATAVEVTDRAMMETADMVLNETAKEHGYTSDKHEAYNFIVKIINGKAQVDDDLYEKTRQRLQESDMGERAMGVIRAEARATAQAEYDEMKKQKMGTKTADITAEDVLMKRSTQAEEIDTEEIIPPVPQFNEQNLPDDMSVNDRALIKGRLTQIKNEIRTLNNKIRDRSRRLSLKTYQKLIELHSEYETMARNPDSISVLEGKVVLNPKAAMQTRVNTLRSMIRSYKRGYQQGGKNQKAEFSFIKETIKSLAGVEGLTKKQKSEIKGMYSSIKTTKQLYNRVPDIIKKTESYILSNQMDTIKSQLDNFIQVMKGKGEGLYRNVKLGTEYQHLADTFVKNYNSKDVDPAEVLRNFKNTPEDKMKLLASQLATGYSAYGTGELGIEEYARMYKQLQEFLTQGRENYILKDKADAEILKRTREKIVEEMTTPAKGELFGQKFADKLDKALSAGVTLFQSYDVILGTIFRHVGTEIGGSFGEQLFKVSNALRQAENIKSYYTSEFQARTMDIFGLDNLAQLNKKFRQDSIAEPGNQVELRWTDRKENVQNKVLSKAAAREKLMISRRKRGRQLLEMAGWTEETLDQLSNQLTDNDHAFIEMQFELYSKMHPMINDTFRNLKGYDIADEDYYSPLYTTDFEQRKVDMANMMLGEKGARYQDVSDQDFLKSITDAKVSLQDVPDFMKLNMFLKDASYYVATAEKLNFIQEVMNHKVRNTIKERYGDKLLASLDNKIKVLSRNTLANDQFRLNRGFNKFLTRLSEAYILGKPSQFFKQVTSSIAAAELTGPIKYVEYVSSLPQAMKSGEALEFFDDPYFIDRYKSRNIGRDMRYISELIETEMPKKGVDRLIHSPKFLDVVTAPVRFGDASGVMINGWVAYQHYKAEGFSKAVAKTLAIDQVNKTQQSPDLAEHADIMLSADPIRRVFSMFTHTPMQYMSRVWAQFATLGTDRFDAKKFANTYATYVVLNYLYSFVSSGFKRGEKEEEALSWIGPFDDGIFFGPMLKWAFYSAYRGVNSAITGEDFKKVSMADAFRYVGIINSVTSNFDQAQKALADIFDEGELTYENALRFITESSEAVPFVGFGAGASAVREVSSALEAMNYAFNGEAVENWRRWLMLFGYTERATRPVEEE